MEQVGYSLVDPQGAELLFWGDTPGRRDGVPGLVVLPNGDHVHCASPGPLQDWRLVPRMLQVGSPATITFDGAHVVVTRPAPVPEPISDRQFFQQLANLTAITQDEALAAVSTGTLPAAMATFIATLPADQQFAAKMVLCGATQFNRDHPMVAQFGAGLGWSDAQIDQLWKNAAAL